MAWKTVRESSLYKQTSGPARVGLGFRVPGRCPEVSESKIDEDPRVGQVVHVIGVFGVSPPIMIFTPRACPKPGTHGWGRPAVRPCGRMAGIAHITCACPVVSAKGSGTTVPIRPQLAAPDKPTRPRHSPPSPAPACWAGGPMPHAKACPLAARSYKLAVAPPRPAHPLHMKAEAPLD
jgi:hypothetical protein